MLKDFLQSLAIAAVGVAVFVVVSIVVEHYLGLS
jgi:hypothetical protein